MIGQALHISWAELPFQGVKSNRASALKLLLLKQTGWYESVFDYFEQRLFLSLAFSSVCEASIILMHQHH